IYVRFYLLQRCGVLIHALYLLCFTQADISSLGLGGGQGRSRDTPEISDDEDEDEDDDGVDDDEVDEDSEEEIADEELDTYEGLDMVGEGTNFVPEPSCILDIIIIPFLLIFYSIVNYES
nr:hypothetical protein [Tanacetum cinerariifolium]